MTISIICSLAVLLLLLSIHACNARQLGVITKKDSEESFHLPNKGKQISSNLKIRLDPSNAQSSGSIVFNKAAINKDFQQEVIKKHDDEHYPRKNLGEVQGHGNETKSSSSPPSTISWNVPQKKKGEQQKQQQPGFNLDYSPPKTHPPENN